MFTDARGLQISCVETESAQTCSAAIESFIRRQTDTIPLLQQSMAHEPDQPFTQALYGLMMHGARKSSLLPDINTALSKATQSGIAITHREQLYVDALNHACHGDLFAMVSCYEKILQQDPTDILALSLAQGELFWLGEMEHSRRLSEMVQPAWSDAVEGYPEYLSVLAFDLEEAGQYQQAEEVGRQSVALRDTNAWGTHAVAHVLYMQGRHQQGVDWLTDKQDRWSNTNQIKYHIWWHQCLFHLEQGQHDVVLEYYDRWVRNHSEALVQVTPDLYIDLQNGASLLWRLEQQGVDIGDRWDEMATLVASRTDDMSSPFTSAHYAVILAATGQYDACDALITAMNQFAVSSTHTLASRFHDAAIPSAIAAVEHRKGRYQNVIDVLMPKRRELWQMGGSHAQQDLFHQILVDAAVKQQNKPMVAMLLKEIEAIGFAAPCDNVAYQTAGQLIQ